MMDAVTGRRGEAMFQRHRVDPPGRPRNQGQFGTVGEKLGRAAFRGLDMSVGVQKTVP